MTTESKPRDSLKVVSLGDLLTHPFPKRDYLLTPWLRQGESVMVWAQAGLGKTMLTLSMALAVAGGGEFLQWKNETPRRVLVVDGEMHAEDLKDRLAMLMPTIAGLDVAAASRNLKLLPRQFQGGEVRFPDLGAPEGQDVILAQIKQHGAELVILDNFATLAEVNDENEAASMTPVLTFLLRLKQAGVACVLVHHSGKTGASYRGSSKLATTFEVILGLRPWEGAAAGAGAAFETEWTKFRGEPHDAIRAALVKLERQPNGPPAWVAVPSESDEVRLLIEAAQSGRFSTGQDIAAALGWQSSKVSRLKARAIKDGRMGEQEWKDYLADGRDSGPPDF